MNNGIIKLIRDSCTQNIFTFKLTARRKFHWFELCFQVQQWRFLPDVHGCGGKNRLLWRGRRESSNHSEHGDGDITPGSTACDTGKPPSYRARELHAYLHTFYSKTREALMINPYFLASHALPKRLNSVAMSIDVNRIRMTGTASGSRVGFVCKWLQ